MSVYITKKNESQFIAAKKKAVARTDKIENVLSIIIVILATIGVLKTLSQTIM
tara:strand:+ start:688 stop:846 length:159 start_codon:yes stop_codon:yes gene_type:complete